MNHSTQNHNAGTKKVLPSVNRRNDIEVRDAIDRIQQFFFSHNRPENVLAVALDEIVNLLACTDGVCFFPKTNNSYHPILRQFTSPIVSSSSKLCSKQLVDVPDIWLKQERHIFRIKVYNNGVPSHYSAMFGKDVHFDIAGFFPIIVSNQLLAIIAVTGYKKTFRFSSISRTSPLLGATVCALQSGKKISYQVSPKHAHLIEDELLGSLINHSPSGIIVIEDNSVVLNNYIAADILNHGSNETSIEHGKLINMSVSQFFPRFDELFQWSKQLKLLDTPTKSIGPQMRYEQKLRRIDGTNFNANVTVFRYFNDDKQYTILQLLDTHTSDSNNCEPKSNSDSTQVRDINDQLPIGMMNLTLDLSCTYNNAIWTQFTGLDDCDSSGSGWIKAVHAEDLRFLLEDLYVCLVFENDIKREIKLISPLGSLRWVDFHASIIFNNENKPSGMMVTVTDITEQRHYASQLKKLAESDHLTGLINRAGFDKKLNKAFDKAKTDQLEISVLFIDLDGFKYVNDTYGHHSGDIVLKEVSKRLQTVLDAQDTACRFGGDEFVVLFKLNRDVKSIIDVAENILKEIEYPFKINNKLVKLSASIGIASSKAEEANANELLKHADDALYQSKRAGKNRFSIYDTTKESKDCMQTRLLNELRQGIIQKSFLLHFQPIINANTKEYVGVEALLRFNNDKEIMIMPDNFVHLLEDSGMIVNVGYWVIDEACKQLRNLINEEYFPKGAYMSINVSAKQLIDKNFVAMLKSSCQKYHIDPTRLVIEITESVMINKPAIVGVVLKELRDYGVRTALDDFGTGYSSMTYLQKFDFDIIKIDKSFIEQLETDSYNMKIVTAIIALANSFNLEVTAEGVEDKRYIPLLNTMGVDNIQGYVISEPKAYRQCVDFIAHRYH